MRVMTLGGWMLLLGIATLSASSVLASPEPAKPSAAKTDLFGDELPTGAIGRLGTLRQRFGEYRYLAFRPDLKSLRTIREGTIYDWDASDGRLVAAKRIDFKCETGRFFTHDLSMYAGVHGGDHVRLVETETGKVHAEWQVPGDGAGGIEAIAENGQRFATIRYGQDDQRMRACLKSRFW